MKNILLIFFLFSFTLLSYTQNWTSTNNNFPYSGVHHPITFSYNQYGFAITGSNTDNVYRYDSDTDNWTQLSPFPGGDRGYAYGVVIGDKGYMGFGSNAAGQHPIDWWEYDIPNDNWMPKANFPSLGRDHPAMIAVDGKVYMGCGSDHNQNFNDWWEYDISNDTWTQKTDLPAIARHHPFHFAINNTPYVGFGHSSLGIHKDFFKYDHTNDNWIQLNDFPGEARVAGTQFAFNNKGYVLSGDGDDHNPLDEGELWEYDNLSDNWTQLPSHPGDAIWAPGCFIVDCSVYFLLGQNTNNFVPIYPLNIYKYKLSTDCGCTDQNAVNYSSSAIIDDGSCCYIAGCTDPFSINYDSTACFDDSSCIQPIIGCTNPTASNFNPNANTTIGYGGALDNTFGAGGYFNGNQYLIVDVNEESIIKSAIFYSNGNNNVTFELRNSSGIVLDDTSHFITPGEQRLELNLNVPIGNNMQLGVSGNNSGLYRNNIGAIYPYDIGGIINIKGTSASQPNYYYFYYSIQVEKLCLNTTNIVEYNKERNLVKVLDVLGRETKREKNEPLFYIYDDGTVEKRITIE